VALWRKKKKISPERGVCGWETKGKDELRKKIKPPSRGLFLFSEKKNPMLQGTKKTRKKLKEERAFHPFPKKESPPLREKGKRKRGKKWLFTIGGEEPRKS